MALKNWKQQNRNRTDNNQSSTTVDEIDENKDDIEMSDENLNTENKEETLANSELDNVDTGDQPNPEPTTAPTDKPTEAPAPAVTVQPTVAPTEAPSAKPTTTTAASGKKAASESVQVLTALSKMNNPKQKKVDSMLTNYVLVMNPMKPVVDGARSQLSMWNTIRSVIEECIDAEEFKLVWGTVLAYFDIHKGDSLADPLVYRFFEELPLTKESYIAFTRMINLALSSCSPNLEARRASMKQVDIEKTLELVWSNKSREFFMAFYMR